MTREERMELAARAERARQKKIRQIKAYAVQMVSCIAVGVVAGIITFTVLNAHASDKQNSLTPADNTKVENVVEKVDEEEATGDSSVVDALEHADEEEAPQETVASYDSDIYPESIRGWSSEEVEAALQERSGYESKSKYQSAVNDYWENVREVRDIDCNCRYLFNTDKEVYTTADFEGVPKDVIHIAKNEIYARHGYSFKDQDLYNYFMGQIWYNPSVLPADFSEKAFSEIEVKNLDMLNTIDK